MISIRKIQGLIFFLLCAGFISCQNDIEKVRVMTEKNNLPVETGKTVQMNYTDSGYLKARVFAPLMERYANDEKNYTEMKKGLTAYFFNRNRKVESYLRSKYAIRYDRDRRMVARTDVVLVNYKGDTLNTEELNWDENTQRIFSDKAVRITTPDEIIFGEGFESSTEFDRYKIFKIKGTISLKK
ncbi:MAG: LPS export ABC transporter periplasmic protein LptC [Bacteroidia bacterium]